MKTECENRSVEHINNKKNSRHPTTSHLNTTFFFSVEYIHCFLGLNFCSFSKVALFFFLNQMAVLLLKLEVVWVTKPEKNNQ